MMDEYGQVGVAILVDGAGVPWLGEYDPLGSPATFKIPTILDGLTMGQALDVVLRDTTYRYRISAVERKRPRYGQEVAHQSSAQVEMAPPGHYGNRPHLGAGMKVDLYAKMGSTCELVGHASTQTDEPGQVFVSIDAAALRDRLASEAVPKATFVIGEQPVRVEGLGQGAIISRQDQDGVVEVLVGHGTHRVRAAIVHRGHLEWVDDD